MKNILFLVFATCLITACCSEKQNPNYVKQPKDVFPSKPVEFVYKNHKYISFGGNQLKSGVVHDPDCPCNKSL